MGKDELLATPGPPAESINPASADIAESAGYTYKREDGTIEVARDAAEAIRRCPILGSLPVEEAGVLLELHAIGTKIMAEDIQSANDAHHTEQRTDTETREQIVQVKPMDKSITKPMETTPSTTLEQSINNGRMAARMLEEAWHHQAIIRQKVEDMEVVNIGAAEVMPTKKTIAQPKNNEKPAVIHTQIKTRPHGVEKAAVVAEAGSQPPVVEASEVVAYEPPREGAVDTPVISAEQAYPDNNGTEIAAVEAFNTDVTTAADESEAPQFSELVIASVEPASPVEAVIEDPEVGLDETTMETYHQLVALLDAMAEESIMTEAETSPAAIDDSLAEIEIGEVETNEFEAFVAARPEAEAPADLEAIQAVANEQPLEETLAQLAVYLAEASPEVPDENIKKSRPSFPA